MAVVITVMIMLMTQVALVRAEMAKEGLTAFAMPLDEVSIIIIIIIIIMHMMIIIMLLDEVSIMEILLICGSVR